MNKDIIVRIMMNKKEKEMLTKICETNHCNMSEMIRQLIIMEYARENK